ncbi:dihydrodipicolinate synthase family protein [Brachybacterium sp. J144]|uniref:dihydrodipicolinate synthase family protein n=1 Tax=Brachybacterium sp. J144 TaxID=3116487 RepID=UPI002E7A14C9|nr:dihydrodipicolinate synthase family protein [Brachybacterium sp. J144]MEE1649753.1 dihydrodipicolinate synthase family protein [Brachybacterium sp. J144]
MTTWLHGLSAFPLTPLRDGGVDETALGGLLDRLVEASVDSIGVLGSTGAYTYLTREQRRRVVEIAVDRSAGLPVLAGIGHCATDEVLSLAEDAQRTGADAVLLAPVSYQRLTDDEVVGLYEDVTRELSVPLVVYDNPATTHVDLSLETYARIAALPQVAAVKIPPVPADPATARGRVAAVRDALPERVRIGVSGDAVGATGLLAGCDLWFSALAGTLPGPLLAIARAAIEGRPAEAQELSARLDGLWELFAECGGSLRVVAAVAQQLGLVGERVLPRPLRSIDAAQQERVARVLAALEG